MVASSILFDGQLAFGTRFGTLDDQFDVEKTLRVFTPCEYYSDAI